MPALTKLDWDVINGQVQSTRATHNLKTSSKALLWIALDQHFPTLQDDRLEIVTDGPDDRGIDAVHIVESDGYAEVFLFQCKCRESFEATDKTINDEDALKVFRFIDALFDRSPDLKACGNLKLATAVERVWRLHEAGAFLKYEVVFCSNDRGFSPSARSILEALALKHDQVRYSHYGPKELVRDLAAKRGRSEDGQLHVVAKEVFERSDGDVRGLIASVDARSYVDLIKTPDGKSIKRHLFDDNLRIFLGTHGGYNAQIIETAISEDAHLFWYLNNGITITCRNFSYNKGHVNPVIALEDFQIVNGAQTSHSLVEASQRNNEALENIVLMVRVYATQRTDVAERVAVATNSQARIQGRDLRANNAVMKKLEAALFTRGYFFERKRNMHSDRDPSLRLDALKLGQIILSFYLREPDKAKTQSDAIFDSMFDQIFNELHDIDELCRVIELYKLIEDMRESYEAEHADHIEAGGAYQYLVYGHWFILYAARLLLLRSSGEVPTGDQAQELAERAVELVAKACGQQKAVAHYQLFRSPRTKEKIVAELSGKQMDFLELLLG
ncbi:MAG TPA: AIPR family protein [Caulobacteraceae bacterium]